MHMECIHKSIKKQCLHNCTQNQEKYMQKIGIPLSSSYSFTCITYPFLVPMWSVTKSLMTVLPTTVPWWGLVYTAWPISGRSPMMTPSAGAPSMLLQKSPLYKESNSPGRSCKERKACLWQFRHKMQRKIESILLCSVSFWKNIFLTSIECKVHGA